MLIAGELFLFVCIGFALKADRLWFCCYVFDIFGCT